ncbi:hypothetical protein GQ602_007259 [Ophiocordyceps camponoti-floridani]|uniref:Uncharacterized protein n=1 Tax=Ophiocordyceps camponoti-floridani TaxID=2030778 RepID=A0A8H4Q124_9HYPO|nr:hypothetical protein GQ602_007259 [Ophiocordyceps camponoti-floridani]
MDKLLEFVELDGPAQYQTTLSSDLWDPSALPEGAFYDDLRKSREKWIKEREADCAAAGRSAVDFVPSTAAAPAASQPVNSGLARGNKNRSQWR